MLAFRNSILLFITASIWGSAFVAQSIGMEHVSPFTFTFFRTLIGALFLIPFLIFIDFKKKHNLPKKPLNKIKFIQGALTCGAILILGESLQQFGLVTTDAGKAGFITSMYIIFVPLIYLLFGHKIARQIVIGVILSLIGLYLLCVKSSITLERGDLLILACAFVFALHIIAIDHFVKYVDPIALSCSQFAVASFIGGILMLIYDDLSLEKLYLAAPAMLYAGIMSNGIAYTLQVIAQRGMNPAIATLILSLESVMAVFFGILFLNESLSFKETIGCALMFIAVIIAQFPFKK